MQCNVFADGSAKLLIDRGCPINIIKRSSLNSNSEINSSIVYNLAGIGTGLVKTLGETIIPLKGASIKFQVVNDNFSIKKKRILGVNFLEQKEAQLIFRSNGSGEMKINEQSYPLNKIAHIRLPARSNTLIALPIQDTDLKEGYLPRINVGPDVYLGKALVSNEEGVVKCFAINSSAEEIEAHFSAPQLEEFTILTEKENSAKKTEQLDAERFARLLKSINVKTLMKKKLMI